jgi:hypothetical protein
MKQRLIREASSGLDSDQKQTNSLLYVLLGVAVLVILGGQGILYWKLPLDSRIPGFPGRVSRRDHLRESIESEPEARTVKENQSDFIPKRC